MNANKALMQVIATAARGYYFDTASNPSYALPAPTPAGAEIFTHFMVERVFAPRVMPRALEAARECDVRPRQPVKQLQVVQSARYR
jgi:hypothetical protein